MDRQQLEKLNSTRDQPSLVFEWIKTGVISLTEFKCYLLDVLEHGKLDVRGQNCMQEGCSMGEHSWTYAIKTIRKCTLCFLEQWKIDGRWISQDKKITNHRETNMQTTYISVNRQIMTVAAYNLIAWQSNTVRAISYCTPAMARHFGYIGTNERGELISVAPEQLKAV